MKQQLFLIVTLVPVFTSVNAADCNCPTNEVTWVYIGRVLETNFNPAWSLPSNYNGTEIEVSSVCKTRNGVPPAITDGVRKIAAYTRTDCTGTEHVFDSLLQGQTYLFSGYHQEISDRTAFVVSFCSERPIYLEYFSTCNCAYMPITGQRGSSPV